QQIKDLGQADNKGKEASLNDKVKQAYPEYFHDNYNAYRDVRTKYKGTITKWLPRPSIELDHQVLEGFVSAEAQEQLEKIETIQNELKANKQTLDDYGIGILKSAKDGMKRVKKILPENVRKEIEKKHTNIFS